MILIKNHSFLLLIFPLIFIKKFVKSQKKIKTKSFLQKENNESFLITIPVLLSFAITIGIFRDMTFTLLEVCRAEVVILSHK